MELSRLDSLYSDGDSLLRLGQFTAACDKYTSVLSLPGFHAKAHLNRACCFLRTDHFVECLKDLRDVLVRPDSPLYTKAVRLQLQCCVRMNDFSPCEPVLKAAASQPGAFGLWAGKQLKAISKSHSLAQEFGQIEKLRKESLTAKEWTILPKDWYDGWIGYTKQQTGSGRPPAIDCSTLIDPLSDSEHFLDPHPAFQHVNFELKKDVQEGLDFLLVPMPVFQAFTVRYSCKGDALRRDAAKGDVELRIGRVKADVCGLEKRGVKAKWVAVSRSENAGAVRERLARSLKQRMPMGNVVEASSRLWQVSKPDQASLTDLTAPLSLSTSSLLPDSAAIHLSAEELIIIEFQQKSGEWLLKLAPKNLCINCHKPGAANLCGGCGQVRYCSRDCQNAHFKVHKSLCKKHRIDPPKVVVPREGLCGLQNLGNTCFMNSALQCVSHVLPLTRYFLQGTYMGEINKGNVLGSGGNLAKAYAGLLKVMWEGGDSWFAPMEFRKVLGKFAPQFSSYMQQDSHELLSYVLDGLHEDLNRVIKKPLTAAVEGNGTDDERVAQESWENHLKRNQSVIVDLMQGQCKSTLVCPQCDRVSITFDPFMTHTLQLSQFEVRPVVVYFVPLAPGPPLKLCFRLRGTCSILNLKSLLLPHINAANMQVWTIVGRKLQRCLVDSQTVEDSRGQTLLAFEIETDFDVAIPVLQTRESDDVISWSRLIFAKDTDSVSSLKSKVSVALEYALDKMSKTSSDELYRIVAIKGKACALCTAKKCKGCPLPVTDDLTVGALRESIGKWSLEVRWGRQCRELRFLDYCDGSDAAKVVESSLNPTLGDCLRLSSSPEVLDAENMWYCSRCEEHVQATKQYEFYRTPQTLIFHLKRFKPRLLDKLTLRVDFPITGLEVKTLACGEAEVYDLFAVVNHIGAAFAGHYTAFVKNQRGGGWFEMNDQQVFPLKEKDVVTPHAYLLFYSKRFSED